MQKADFKIYTMNTQFILVQEEPRGPSELIEIPVLENGKSRIPFPDSEQLRNMADQTVVIKAIRLVTIDILTRGVLNDQPNAPITELQKLSMTLYSEGWERGHNTPLLILNDMTVPGGTAPHRYGPTKYDNWMGVQWKKSYLQYAAGTLSAGAPYLILMDVEYVKLDNFNQPILGPS